ncbi:FtsX-like permease family protein [Microbacterium sp.]|uniref:FtsX-like permease family protein n=1 Tax=Microbacterium sp. TaxID=51671 RepID=UPI003F97B7DE
MIIRVAVRELVRGWRLWAGSIIVIVASSAVCAAAMSQFETAATLGDDGVALQSMSQVILAFGLLSAIAVTAATTNLAVASGRRGYALLQLAGVLPRQLVLIVFSQLVILSLVGSILGLGVGRLAASPLLEFTIAQTGLGAAPPLAFGSTTLVWTLSLISGVVLLSGARSAFRAGRVRPIEALREPEPPKIRMGVLRWVGVGVALAAAAGMGLGLAFARPRFEADGHLVGLDSISGFSMMLSVALTALAATLGPVLYPLVLRAWTALIPAAASGTWFLARRSCSYRITQSTAAVTPLMVGIALPGTMYTIALTTASAVGGPADINTGSIFASLGPALFLAAIGAAATIFMTGRTRERDNALVQVSGGTVATTTLAAIFEAVIYVMTAFLLAAAIFATVGVVASIAFSPIAPGIAPTLGVATAALIALVGLAIVSTATLLPALSPSRRSIPSILATE